MRPRRTTKPALPGLSLVVDAGDRVVLTLPCGDTITVTNVSRRQSRTVLHFAAPRDIPIVRGKLLDRTAQTALPAA